MSLYKKKPRKPYKSRFFGVFWRRARDSMGSAHHSLRERPIVFGSAESGFESRQLKFSKKQKHTRRCTSIFGGEHGIRWASPIIRYANARLCSAPPRVGSNPVNLNFQKNRSTPVGVLLSLAESKGFEPSKRF